MPEKLRSDNWGFSKESCDQTRVSEFKVDLILVTSGDSHQKNTTFLHFIWKYWLNSSPHLNNMFGGKSWACHPARNYVTSTNVRNISLCLPAYRHRRSWACSHILFSFLLWLQLSRSISLTQVSFMLTPFLGTYGSLTWQVSLAPHRMTYSFFTVPSTLRNMLM